MNEHPEHTPRNITSYSGNPSAVKIAAFLGIKEPSKAYEFVKAVRQAERPVPVSEQRDMAKFIKEDKVATPHIKQFVRAGGHKPKPRELPDFFEFLEQNRALAERLTRYVREINKVQAEVVGKERSWFRVLQWTTFREAAKILHKALGELLEQEGGNKYGKETSAKRDERPLPLRSNQKLLAGKKGADLR